MLKFDLRRKSTREERVETYQQITRRLEECKKHIRESAWRGLTELTQKNGEICHDSVGFLVRGFGVRGDDVCANALFSVVPYTSLERQLPDRLIL